VGGEMKMGANIVNIKSNKILSVGLIAVLGLVFLLSTLAMSPSQTTATPTIAVSVTNTELPTATPTYTPTATPTSIPTPAYPSVQEIDHSLQDDFAKINSSIEEIKQQTWLSHLSNIFDNFVSNIIWAILVGIASFLSILKAALKFKINRDKARGIAPNNRIENLEATFEVSLNIILFIAGVYLILALSFANRQSSTPIDNRTELSVISERLGNIEKQLELLAKSGNQNTPINPPEQNQPLDNFLRQVNKHTLAILLTSLLANFLLILVYGGRRLQLNIKSNPPNFGLTNTFDQEIYTAIFLALILLLLPYPAETFLLPFILQYLILAFLDLIRLYPNLQIKKTVIRNYSLIILFAELGVWASFIDLIIQYLNKYLIQMLRWVLEIVVPNSSAQISNEFSQFVVQYLPAVALPLLTLILAIPDWLNIRKISKKEKIPAIIQSIQDLEKQNETSKNQP
jgi:hypothetical protein